MDLVERGIILFADTAWSYLLYLLMGGGLFLLLYSRFMPLRHFRHSIEIIRGKYDDPNETGDITHFQALVSALAATLGMGNISGVAVAIAVGGPGAIFWMWASALVGIATKFFTCSLAIMYRGEDSAGKTQGGPMYVVREGLGRHWKPLAVFFAFVGVIGCLPLFQVNQLVQIIRDVIFVPMGVVGQDHFWFDLIAGILLVLILGTVIFGGITRIADVATRVVPAMVILYMICALWIILLNIGDVPRYLMLIITDAFTGEAAAGGAVGAVIITGVRRAAFSNEAGIGTESLVHGATKTREPAREGMVAMLEPVIDTMIVCTCTALVILMTGVWQTTTDNGVTLTSNAFESAMPGFGSYMLIICVLFFSASTIFTYSYYGTKCLGFLIGARYQFLYNYFYVGCVILAAVSSLDAAISLVDSAFAMMAIPTVLSALILSPKVMAALRDYRQRYRLSSG